MLLILGVTGHKSEYFGTYLNDLPVKIRYKRTYTS
jgi:hypothetical protein